MKYSSLCCSLYAIQCLVDMQLAVSIVSQEIFNIKKNFVGTLHQQKLNAWNIFSNVQLKTCKIYWVTPKSSKYTGNTLLFLQEYSYYLRYWDLCRGPKYSRASPDSCREMSMITSPSSLLQEYLSWIQLYSNVFIFYERATALQVEW